MRVGSEPLDKILDDTLHIENELFAVLIAEHGDDQEHPAHAHLALLRELLQTD